MGYNDIGQFRSRGAPVSRTQEIPKKWQAFPRVMHDQARGTGQEACKNVAGRVGPGQEVFKISRDGSGRAVPGQYVFTCHGRAGPSRVRRFLRITGPVRSGRVGSGRVGSGRVGSGRVGSGRVTLSS